MLTTCLLISCIANVYNDDFVHFKMTLILGIEFFRKCSPFNLTLKLNINFIEATNDRKNE